MALEDFYNVKFNLFTPEVAPDMQGGETLTYSSEPDFSIAGKVVHKNRTDPQIADQMYSRVDAIFLSLPTTLIKRGSRVADAAVVTWVPPTAWNDGSFWAYEIWEAEGNEQFRDHEGVIYQQRTQLFRLDLMI